MKSSSAEESAPTETPPEPAQEMISEDVDEGISIGVLPQSEQTEVEVPQEGPKKKRRGLF